ncbi:hypothetical protein [Candidatus Poriferisodalis sp.]|uniref:hypothetical protein n=1 Tax=Candidatus Poriferisodalis sp. TaxID=3101277 RepID=UPI003B52E676
MAVLAVISNPLQTASAHVKDDHTHVCTSPPAASCPSYEDDVPAEITIWSTTMTVGIGGFTSGSTTQETTGYSENIGSLSSTEFTYSGTTYTVTLLYLDKTTFSGSVISDTLSIVLNALIPSQYEHKVVLELNGTKFPLADAIKGTNNYQWVGHGLTWTDNESVTVKLTEPPTPNAYGYRTIWSALMTAEQHPTVTTRYGYSIESYGEITNNLIVDGRDETVTIGTKDQLRFPWTGFEIVRLNNPGSSATDLVFDSDSYPSADEVAGWTLVLDGKELPFANATNDALTPHLWSFSYAPGWTAGDQVLVSIRTKDVQNRFGQVALKARRSISRGGNDNIVYGKTHYTYAREDSGFGPGESWDLQNLRVKTDKTGDTDPVWITATFTAPNASVAWPGYWEGEFEHFHTLFLRWIYQVDGVGEGAATYTLPLRTAATEGGVRLDRSGRDITFTWVRTYKEFQDRHLDLANHTTIFADMLTAPRPVTARSTLTSQNTGNQQGLHQRQGLYTPAPTVTSAEFTSSPGDDQVYGPWSIIQATLTFDQDVTVGYVGSKRNAASLELEMNGETKTAYYERTEGNKVIFEYTVLPGDEAPVALRLPINSLKLFSERGHHRDDSIRNSEGTDAVLDHNGILSTKHRVDAVDPEFSSAEVSNDGAQVMVTLTEDIKSPSILRAFGLQTGLLQSLALDVWVDGELPVRSDATVSGDTVTLTMSEPITEGQTVTVSYNNLFTNSEPIFSDLHGNNLLAFTKQPAANHSTVADVTQPGGGLALSRTDLIIKEGSTGTYTVVLTSQPTNDVTVSVDDHPPGRATVSPSSLTFTAESWNTPQTVTISSAEDSNYLDRWVMLRHTATGDNYRATAAAWLILRDNYNLTTTTPNTPAAGSPTISGTPEVGQTLTLDISSITDAEGLTNAYYTYLYQWLRNGAEIRDATDTSYTLVDADEGETIKVKVSFTDDANNAESRTSAATVAVAPRPNSAPTGAPAIDGTPQVRRTLMVDTSEIADADGMETAVFRYQWLAATDFATLEFHGETSPTYTLGPATEGLAIQVKVFYTDDRGHTETLTSAATEAVIAAEPNSEPTGLPTIDGTPQVGETLTADTSAIGDADGLDNVSYRYQWVASQSVIDAGTGVAYILTLEIPDQTGSTYTLAPADEGWTFEVKVSFTDDAGNAESLTSMATTAVADHDGSLLTASFANVPADHDGSNFTFGLNFSENVNAGYARIRDDAFTVSGGTIASASRMTQGSNQGWTVEVDPDGNGPVSITLPETTDCDASGAICTHDSTKLSQSTSATVAGPPAIAISDATVTRTIENGESSSGTQEDPPAEDPPAETPAVLLTASFGNMPATHNGAAFTFDLTFSEEFGISYVTLRDNAFSVTTGDVTSARRLTQGSNIGWTITVTPDSAADVTIVLPVTTDCNANGAVCTADARMLSNRQEFTVSGPGE